MAAMSSSSRRKLVDSSVLGAGAALALALLVIVNYFGWKYHARFDWTESRLYSLSEKTENVLAALDHDVEAVVFMSPGEQLYDPVRELLARYEAASPRISVRTIDPERNPAEAQSLVDTYQITQLNVVVFDSGEDRRVVEGADLAEYDYSGYQYGEGPKMTGFKGEQAFTGAIIELAEDRKPSMLFTTGHGEVGADDFSGAGLSQAQEMLGRDNFSIESWASLGQPEVPEGTDLVVIAGPTLRFAEPEVEVLRRYLARGGRLLAMLDPQISERGELGVTGLEPLLADYGLSVGSDLVVDPANPLPFYGAETIFVDSYGDHPITRSLDQTQVPVILPLARSVRREGDVEGFESVELLETSDEGWGETDMAHLNQVEFGDGDLEGPVSLAVAVQAEGADGDAEAEVGGESAERSQSGTRLVVFGDSTFASNSQLANVGNSILLANTMNWLVERENLVAIPPKAPEQVRLNLDGAQLRWLTWTVLALLPGLALFSGVAVFYRRRR